MTYRPDAMPANLRSARIMEKLGMRYRGNEVWHGRTTLVYEIDRASWQARGAR